MEERSQSTGYWCYGCSRAVDTVMEVEMITCSLCHGGFVEELGSLSSANPQSRSNAAGNSGPDHPLSLLAPILLGMMSNPRRLRRFRQIQSDNENSDNNDTGRELGSVRRRRRSSATILHLLQGIQAGMLTDSGDDFSTNGDHERVIVVNPFNQRIIVQGSGARSNPFGSGRPPQTQPMGVLGDYFLGPDMELLLQHLAELSPTRYGTRPAQKKAVETMPTVKIEDLDNSIRCSVCLEDLLVGNEAKEMPCKHRFHGECILPWLELHNTCPVCRYQLPYDDVKIKREPESTRGIRSNRLTGPGNENGESGQDGSEGGNARGLSVTFPMPFNSLFTSPPGTQITNPNLIINPPESEPGPTGQEGGDH